MDKSRIVKISKFKFLLNFGVGYWSDSFNVETHGTDGKIHHILLPFSKLELGRIVVPSSNTLNRKQKKVDELRKRIKRKNELRKTK